MPTCIAASWQGHRPFVFTSRWLPADRKSARTASGAVTGRLRAGGIVVEQYGQSDGQHGTGTIANSPRQTLEATLDLAGLISGTYSKRGAVYDA